MRQSALKFCPKGRDNDNDCDYDS